MPRPTFFWLLLLALAAGLMLYLCTPAGLGLTNDSAAYLGGARSILAGTGYSDIWLDSSLEPLTHYPPLLSLTLSGIGLLGLDPYRGARLLNIFLYAVNAGLLGWLGWRITRSQSAALFLALMFGLNAQLLNIHAYVLSEPLYLFFSLCAFLLLDFSRDSRHPASLTRLLLLLTGLSTGLAFLTRYSGLALIAACLAATFLFQLDWRSRLRSVALLLGGALPPIFAWFLRNALVAQNATNRVFQYHPILIKNIRYGLRNFSQFLTPVETWQSWLFSSGVLQGTLIVIGLFLLGWLAYRTSLLQRGQADSTPLTTITVLYSFAYLGAVLFSMSFFDASTKFQHRILSPLYLSWMVLFVAVCHAISTRYAQNRLTRLALLALAGWVLGFSALGDQRAIVNLRAAGQGYASWQWRDSLVMAALKKLPPDMIIYTNTPPAVYLVTGRPSRVLPSSMDPVDNLPRGDYEQNLAQLRADLASGRAVLALFDTTNIEDALGMTSIEQISPGMTVLEKSQGDILYGIP